MGKKPIGHLARKLATAKVKPVCAGVFFLLAACDGNDRARWSEEVELANGKLVVLERSATALSSGLPVSRRGPTVERRILFPNSSITWTGDGSLVPLAVEIDDVTSYVSLNLRGRAVCERYQDPQFSVIFLKWDAGAWKQIARSEFPSGGKANLLTNPWASITWKDVSGLVPNKDKHLAAPYNFDVNKPLNEVLTLPNTDACRMIPRVPQS